MDIVFKIIAALSPFLSFALGLLASKIKKLQDKNEQVEEEKKKLEQQQASDQLAMKEVCKYVLLKALKDNYEYFVEQGWRSNEDMEEIDKLYNMYHKQFGGNASGTRYYNDIHDLPHSPQQARKDK